MPKIARVVYTISVVAVITNAVLIIHSSLSEMLAVHRPPLSQRSLHSGECCVQLCGAGEREDNEYRQSAVLSYEEVANQIPHLDPSYCSTNMKLGTDLKFDTRRCPVGSLMRKPRPANFSPEHLNCPTLYLVGARKGGTTSLYQYISKHPDFGGMRLNAGPKAGESFYFSHFYETKSWESYISLFPGGGVMTGDSSVGNLVHHLAPKRLYNACGKQAKVVMLLRDPVKRLESNFLMRSRLRKTHIGNQTSVSTVLKMELDSYFQEVLKKTLNVKKLPNEWSKLVGLYLPAKNMVFEGLYYVHLLNWLCNFPAENILIINSEEFYRNSSTILDLVFQFLGLKRLDAETYDWITSATYNKGNYTVPSYQKLSQTDITNLLGLWLCTVDSAGGVLDTTLALPVYSSAYCREANSSDEFTSGVVVASQQYNATVPIQIYLYSPGNDHCASYLKMLQSRVENYTYTLDFDACTTDIHCASWWTLCKKEVYGIKFRIAAPTYSAVSVLFTPTIKQCLALYPLPLHRGPSEDSSPSYIYHVIQSTRATKASGFVVQNPSDDDVTISINLTSRAIGSYNGEMVTLSDGAMNLECREVLWVEPDGTEADQIEDLLSGTVLSSATPLNVFTSLARLEGVGSQLVHQMPERSQWGKHFIVDPKNLEVMPSEIRSCLMHEISIVSYNITANRAILLRSNSITTELITPTRSVPGEHYEYSVYYTQAEMKAMSYLETVSPSPVVVLHTVYMDPELPTCRNYSVHYSTLIQPVEWHANKQIVVLVHPKRNMVYNYVISIVVPSGNSDPADIFESKLGDRCHSEPLSSYHASQHPAGGNYTLIAYKRSVTSSVGETQTRFLLYHSDVSIRIGATVYAYAEDFQYSYSNGYTLGGDSNDTDTLCAATPSKSTSTPSHTVVVSVVTVTATMAGIAVLGVVLVKKCRKKRRNNRYDQLFTAAGDDDDVSYQYDIFILCADEDEGFVTDFIEGPLNELGYRTVRKNTAPDGLFTPGNQVVSDIDKVVKLSSQVIVVCSANYCSSASDGRSHCNIELNYCKELISSNNGRVIPIILDEGGISDFAEFTQHRVRTADILSSVKARRTFMEKLQRDIHIRT